MPENNSMGEEDWDRQILKFIGQPAESQREKERRKERKEGGRGRERKNE